LLGDGRAIEERDTGKVERGQVLDLPSLPRNLN
jgi:hypothetical protein